MNGEKKTSPWVYVGIGCAVIVVLGIAAVGTLGFFGYRWAKRVESEMKDPATREAKAKAVLGTERLPEGYHAMVSLSIPFVMDMAMLSDQAPREGGEIRGFGERGFMYFQMINPRYDEREMRDYFEGRTDDPSVLRRSGINVDVHAKEVLRRGVLEMDGYAVMYMAQRGGLHLDHGRTEGINAMMLVDCPEDGRLRMAIWFGPDPDKGAPPGSANLQGSPADEDALRAFMGHFRLCGRRSAFPAP
jgi:hypothetical protein